MRPILYSFRRCPWAIKARMALIVCHIGFELREVSLKDKPKAMLQASSKGTVPVLVLEDRVIDQSMDILNYAITQQDPGGYALCTQAEHQRSQVLVGDYFSELNTLINHYKYPERHGVVDKDKTLQRLQNTLMTLEQILSGQQALVAERLTATDLALFPHIRQMVRVNEPFFLNWPLPHVILWYQSIAQSDWFARVMEKHAVWQPGQPGVIISD